MGIHKPLKSDYSFDIDVSSRGYVVLFRPDRTNHCPGCGHSQWFVGRISAECGICGTALPLASDAQQSPVNTVGKRAVALHVVPDEGGRNNGADRRTTERKPAKGRVLGLHVDGSPHPFKLENISEGGAMGGIVPGMEDATTLMIELEDGTMLPAELRWSEGGYAGLAFLKPKD